jgi:hypothetical protein
MIRQGFASEKSHGPDRAGFHRTISVFFLFRCRNGVIFCVVAFGFFDRCLGVVILCCHIGQYWLVEVGLYV